MPRRFHEASLLLMQAGIPQQAIADAANTTIETVNAQLCGKRPLSENVLAAIGDLAGPLGLVQVIAAQARTRAAILNGE